MIYYRSRGLKEGTIGEVGLTWIKWELMLTGMYAGAKVLSRSR